MNVNSKRVMARCAAALAVTALAAACQSGGGAGDKAGGDTVVLKLASIDEVNDNGQSYAPQAFVDSLGKISGGRLKVEITTSYGEGAADDEPNLVKAIASGEVDGGWPATRAFASAGISGLDAVEAPMTITSYAAEKAVVTGPVADALLARLDGSGVVGLGLAVGPLRRPFAVKAPLLGPADWKGVTFRAFSSPVQAEAIKALGASPANLGFDWIDEAHAGRLGGVELDIPQYATNGFTHEAGNVTGNVVLWPKVFVLSFSKKRFDGLSEQQQGWVRQAAKDAVKASADATYDETTPARALCTVGVRFFWASPDQVAAMRASLQPVLDRLAADPTSGPLLRDIQAVVAKYPQPLAPDVPQECRQSMPAPVPAASIPSQVSALPDGVYRAEFTEAAVEAAGISNNDGWSGTWTLTVKHGTYEVRCRPIAHPGQDCGNNASDGPLEVGDLRGGGATVWFVPQAQRLSALTGCKLPPSGHLPDHCGPDDPYSAKWSVSRDKLTFSDSPVPTLRLGPWTKIG